MSGSSSRTVHCPCGRVSECTGAETFLQHDAHQAASAPLPLFLNIFFFEHFKMFASFLTFLQHDAHPDAGGGECKLRRRSPKFSGRRSQKYSGCKILFRSHSKSLLVTSQRSFKQLLCAANTVPRLFCPFGVVIRQSSSSFV